MQDTFEIVDIPLTTGRGRALNPLRDSLFKSLFELQPGKAMRVPVASEKEADSLYQSMFCKLKRQSPGYMLHQTRSLPDSLCMWISKRVERDLGA